MRRARQNNSGERADIDDARQVAQRAVQMLLAYSNRKSEAAIAVAGAASPNSAMFTTITMTKKVSGKYRVSFSIEVQASAATTFTASIMAAAHGGALAAVYNTEVQTSIAGTQFVTIAATVDFDGAAGGFALLAEDVNLQTDVAIQIAASAGTITCQTGHGSLIVQELAA